MSPERESDSISRNNQENQGHEDIDKDRGENSQKQREDNERKRQIEEVILLENRGEREEEFSKAAILLEDEGFPEEEAKATEEKVRVKESSEKLNKLDWFKKNVWEKFKKVWSFWLKS